MKELYNIDAFFRMLERGLISSIDRRFFYYKRYHMDQNVSMYRILRNRLEKIEKGGINELRHYQ